MNKNLSISKRVIRLVMRVSPICYVHHIHRSFGWVLLPLLPWTIGYMQLGKVVGFKSGECVYSWSWRIIRTKHMHNCSWSGIY